MRILLFIFSFLACVLFAGCDSTEVEGTKNPFQLNIPKYTFDKEGGIIKIYDKGGMELFPYLTEEAVPVPERENWWNTERLKQWTGEWYIISTTFSSDTLTIEVKANNTGKERVLPIRIVDSINMGVADIEYKQAK